MGTYAGDPAVDVEYPLAFANSFAKTLRGRTEKFRLLFLSGALAEQDQNKTLWFYQAARRAKVFYHTIVPLRATSSYVA